jgi:hypothetical protein
MLAPIDELFEEFKKAKQEERIKILEKIADYNFSNKYEVVKALSLLVEILGKASGKLKNSAINVLVKMKERGAFDILIDEVRSIFGEFSEGDFDFGIEEEVSKGEKEELNIHDFYDFVMEFHPEEEVKEKTPEEKIKEEEEKKKAKEKREKYPDLMDFEIPED